MLRRVALLAALAACGDDAATPDAAAIDASPIEPDAWAGGDGFQQVGHVDLDDDAFLNQGLTIAGDHAYTGHGFGGGVTITDISDPTAPFVVDRFQPSAEIVELIAIADLQRLYTICRGCAPEVGLAVFDLSTPTAPTLIDVFEIVGPQARFPHELFLWRDPADADRVLAFVSDVTLGSQRAIQVIDVSDPANMTERYRSAGPASHAISVSRDSTRLYVSLLDEGVEIFDATQVLGTGASPAVPSLTTAANRFLDCTGTNCITHSTIEVPGRDLAVVTYESDNCPKGWMDIIDVSDPAAITKVGEYRHPKYELCQQDEPYLGLFGYGPHNPTVTEHLALVSWYRAGLIAFDLTDPAAPTPLFAFAPDVPDPASESRWGKLASVSYPIVRDGLIYILDGRNGIDILRYHGPYEDELTADAFFEGSSNL